MSLEELLRDRIIMKIRPNRRLALNSMRRAKRDIDTAKILIENRKFDWSVAVSYNAMLSAGRALMFKQGYRPSSTEGHVAVVDSFMHHLGLSSTIRLWLIEPRAHWLQTFSRVYLIRKSERLEPGIWRGVSAERIIDIFLRFMSPL